MAQHFSPYAVVLQAIVLAMVIRMLASNKNGTLRGWLLAQMLLSEAGCLAASLGVMQAHAGQEPLLTSAKMLNVVICQGADCLLMALSPSRVMSHAHVNMPASPVLTALTSITVNRVAGNCSIKSWWARPRRRQPKRKQGRPRRGTTSRALYAMPRL